jgi:hypothetical protein
MTAHNTMIENSPSAEAVYESALAEHPEYADFSADRLFEIIERSLGRIAIFEEEARKPLTISPEVAEKIGAVRIHSGVGNYDMPIKEDDNPRLIKSWARWADRRRIDHAVRIARKVAEVRSGYKLAAHPTKDKYTMREETRELIREFGPYVIYSGYPSETNKAEEVLDRPDTIIPREKAIIVHGNPKNTVDGSKMMAKEFPSESLKDGKQAVIVTHAPHLERVLHIMSKHPYLPAGSIPYVAPVATSPEGQAESALMETRGILYYTLLKDEAGEEPHPYQLLNGAGVVNSPELV